MNKKTLYSTVLLSFFFLALSAHAQSSGLVTCQGSDCTIDSFFLTISRTVTVAFGLLLSFAAVKFTARVVMYGWNSSIPEVRKKTNEAFLWAVIGAFGLVLTIPMTRFFLEALNADQRIIEPLDKIELQSSHNFTPYIPFIQTAHAQGVEKNLLPQTANVGGSIYTYALNVFQTIMQVFFLGVVVLWVWSGILLVLARGKPGELEKAKGQLWYSFYATVILMFMQALLFALKSNLG